MKAFDYLTPKDTEEACQMLAKYGRDAQLMAGGTDLLVKMKKGEISPKYVIDLKKIQALNGITYDGERDIVIGALATVDAIESSPIIKKHCPLLGDAASVLGSVQVRNKATIGGNLCHASPSADLAPALIVLESRLKIIGTQGERIERVEDFFLGPGSTVLGSDELVSEIHIPAPPSHAQGTYLKFSARRAMDLAVVGAASLISLRPSDAICRSARIALGAVAPTPIRIKNAEEVLEGRVITEDLIQEASNVAAEEARPISDVRGSDWYRRAIVKVQVQRCITQTLAKINR